MRREPRWSFPGEPCTELVSIDPPRYCEAPGVLVVLRINAAGDELEALSRPIVVGGPYCPAHGGELRATETAERDWHYLAPSSVGDSVSVVAAGNECLRTPEAYLTIRQEGDHWLAWLGVGSLLQPIPSEGLTSAQRRAAKRHPDGAAMKGTSYAFGSRAVALVSGLDEWRKNLARRVAVIRAARGGTLAWGVPVSPLPMPIVLEPQAGESAWDVLERLETPTHGGLMASITGLRPTGEAAAAGCRVVKR